MSSAKLVWHDYKYLPYERILSRREVAAVLGSVPKDVCGGLRVAAPSIRTKDLKRLSYFKCIETGGQVLVPDQACLEASNNSNGQTWDPSLEPVPQLRRQSTRYSAHGLHEYRGKFNPQIVRVIANMLGVGPRDWVLDPFCGSGTTLLEAAHMGWNCVGMDLNPLGVMISNAKVKAVKAKPGALGSRPASRPRKPQTPEVSLHRPRW